MTRQESKSLCWVVGIKPLHPVTAVLYVAGWGDLLPSWVWPLQGMGSGVGLEKGLHQRAVGLEQAAQGSVTAPSAGVRGGSDNAFRHRVWVWGVEAGAELVSPVSPFQHGISRDFLLSRTPSAVCPCQHLGQSLRAYSPCVHKSWLSALCLEQQSSFADL